MSKGQVTHPSLNSKTTTQASLLASFTSFTNSSRLMSYSCWQGESGSVEAVIHSTLPVQTLISPSAASIQPIVSFCIPPKFANLRTHRLHPSKHVPMSTRGVEVATSTHFHAIQLAEGVLVQDIHLLLFLLGLFLGRVLQFRGSPWPLVHAHAKLTSFNLGRFPSFR